MYTIQIEYPTYKIKLLNKRRLGFYLKNISSIFDIRISKKGKLFAMKTHAYNPHVSVDCVLTGFNGESLKVLLTEQSETPNNKKGSGMKLPGRPIFDDEDLDEAAHKVLLEITGMNDPYLKQFKTFGAPDRTSNPDDLSWLEETTQVKMGRIVTIGYMSVIRITNKMNMNFQNHKVTWCPVQELPRLAFDHKNIIEEAIREIRRTSKLYPAILFELLPAKFTALELRRLYEVIYDKEMDVRNFHKKITAMPYVIALEEKQTNVAHRAARYYRFDKKTYNKLYGQY